MADRGRSDSPFEAAAGATGPGAIEAFKQLGNETRLAILVALWEAYEPHGTDDAVPFSELYERVGVRDSGQFNYHLDKLEGRFVRKTDDGYRLRRAGLMLVQSIIAGTGFEEPSFDPTEIDAPCDLCGAPTAITYGNGFVYQVCTECEGRPPPGGEHPDGVLLGWTFEPTGLSGRSAEETFAASTVKNYGRIALRFEGICPACSGSVEWSFDVCEDHDPSPEGCPACGRDSPVIARETCTVCKSSGEGPPGIKVLFHPAVVAFYYDHGIELGFAGDTDYTDVLRTLELVEGFDEEVVSTEPLRVRVTIRHGADELWLVLDEGMNVVEVSDSD